MLGHSRRHCEDVGVENYVLRIEIRLFYEQTVRPLAYPDAPFQRRGLPLLVKRHYDRGRAELADFRRMRQKFRLSCFQAY